MRPYQNRFSGLPFVTQSVYWRVARMCGQDAADRYLEAAERSGGNVMFLDPMIFRLAKGFFEEMHKLSKPQVIASAPKPY